MYTIDTCPHVGCKDCKYYDCRPERNQCKRIDHDKIRFAISCFKSYDCGDFHTPCNDFIPKHKDYASFKDYETFDNLWEMYVQAWLPYSNTDVTVGFVLNKNTDIIYDVPLMDFVNNTMFEKTNKGVLLKAVQKRYYKRTKKGFGYKLIKEPISGVYVGIKSKGE